MEDKLFDICDREHYFCNDNCPVFLLNGHKPPDTANNFKVNHGCDCFMNGEAMLDFILSHIPPSS
jgi:hypothetical protein